MFQSKGGVTLAAMVLVAPSINAPQAAERSIQFQRGATATTLKGIVRGESDRTFVLQAAEEQVLQSILTVSNRSCAFTVFEPGQQAAVHIGSISGNEFGRNPTRQGAIAFGFT